MATVTQDFDSPYGLPSTQSGPDRSAKITSGFLDKLLMRLIIHRELRYNTLVPTKDTSTAQIVLFERFSFGQRLEQQSNHHCSNGLAVHHLLQFPLGLAEALVNNQWMLAQ